MIPQRNISLISNTLMTAGGRRIPEAVIERDHLLAFSVFRIGCWEFEPSQPSRYCASRIGTPLQEEAIRQDGRGDVVDVPG
jgi:hypothetical protein